MQNQSTLERQGHPRAAVHRNACSHFRTRSIFSSHLAPSHKNFVMISQTVQGCYRVDKRTNKQTNTRTQTDTVTHYCKQYHIRNVIAALMVEMPNVHLIGQQMLSLAKLGGYILRRSYSPVSEEQIPIFISPYNGRQKRKI